MNEEKNNSEETKESSPEEIIVRLEKEKQEYLDGWKRAKADLINYRKDELKRFEEIARFGTEDVMLDLTLILDSFDLALHPPYRIVLFLQTVSVHPFYSI